MHTLLFYEVGHFHAALLLRKMNPRVSPVVHVYAEPGPDLDRFRALIDGFNNRATEPTVWDPRMHEGPNPLERLIAERRGELVMVAGRNATKLDAIRHLHGAGLAVLADKPWIMSAASVSDLNAVTAGAPTAMDIMTQRHEVSALLRHRVVATESVFGRFIASGSGPVEPEFESALEFRSVHHLCKTVDGRPLRRPEWYYDVRVQGDGLVDIQSHLVDQAQWLIEAAPPADAKMSKGEREGEPIIDRAERWATPVAPDVYLDSTGADMFPTSLEGDVRDGVLQLACNGRLDYRLRGVAVSQHTTWEARHPPGGGDTHTAIARGKGAIVVVRHGPETSGTTRIHLAPGQIPDLAARVSAALGDWRDEFPGLDTAETDDDGVELLIPPTLETPHETNFVAVLDDFLDRVDQGRPSSELAARIRTRYTLLARAHEMAAAAER